MKKGTLNDKLQLPTEEIEHNDIEIPTAPEIDHGEKRKTSEEPGNGNYRNLCKTTYFRLPSSIVLHTHARSYVDITVCSPDVAVSEINGYKYTHNTYQ